MEQQQENKGKGKYILLGFGVVATATLGYFGWQFWKSRRARMDLDVSDYASSSHAALPPAPSGSRTPIRNDEFPLKKGSKGERVRQFQQALISKYGSSVLPKFGADGDFGSEMVNALKSKGLPASIDESTFNVLVKTGNGNAGADSASLAKSLFNAATGKNFNAVIDNLKKIRSVDEYSQVSEAFKNYRIGGVRTTLVNGLLKSFSTDNQKQAIRMEFLRMGLKYDGDKWSLSGISHIRIVTTNKAVVRDFKGHVCEVPANTVLGWAIASDNLQVKFITVNNQKLSAESKDVKPIQHQCGCMNGILKEGTWVKTGSPALVMGERGNLDVVPEGILIGKYAYEVDGWAYIKTAKQFTIIKSEFLIPTSL